MRIIAGRFKSRLLVAPQGSTTRPTTDRAREALFNVLNNLISFEGVRVLDLFAGSGALAFEALSRGAERATLVERDRHALAAIRANVEALGVSGQVTIHGKDVFAFLRKSPEHPFSIIFVDAPYDDTRTLIEVPATLLRDEWLAPNGLCIIEHRFDDKVVHPEGAIVLRELKAGEASFTILTHANPSPT